MADKVVPGPVEGSAAVREAVCIHTRKIFDSCRDKDCVEDLRVYPTACSQAKLDCALSVRPRSAELLCADVHVKEITFNKGYYTVDVTYFYRVRGETFPGCEPVCGLAIFDKRVMLFGSQASAKVFASDDCCCDPCENGLPIGVVESVDPIALHMKLVDCGTITVEEAEHHPQKNIITKALGVDYRLEPECTIVKVQPGDLLLLCSDGLTNAVPREDIEQLLGKGSFCDLPDRLVDTADENGGPDNITALLLGVEPLEVRHG